MGGREEERGCLKKSPNERWVIEVLRKSTGKSNLKPKVRWVREEGKEDMG